MHRGGEDGDRDGHANEDGNRNEGERGDGGRAHTHTHALQGRGPDTLLDLRPYLNQSAPRVPHTCSVSRAYDTFRSLGLRHLCVVVNPII
jgi:hypothetical protein